MPLVVNNFQVKIGSMPLSFTGSIYLSPNNGNASGLTASCSGCGCGDFSGIRIDLANGNMYDLNLILGGGKTPILAASLQAQLANPFDYWQAMLVPNKAVDALDCCSFSPQIEMVFDSSGNLQSAYDNARPRGTSARLIGTLQNQLDGLKATNAQLQGLVNALRAQVEYLNGGSSNGSPEDKNDALLASLIGGGPIGGACKPVAEARTAGTFMSVPPSGGGCSSC
jgi:hypothetical protein